MHARVPKIDAQRFTARCAAQRVSPSAVIRQALCVFVGREPGAELTRLTRLAKAPAPADVLVAIAELLGLERDTDPEIVVQALDELISEMFGKGAPDAPAAEPTDEVAAPPPPKSALSKRERDLCAKHKIAPAEYLRRKAAAVRRVK